MKIAPSILNADYGRLQDEINSIKTCDRIHLDVMDGHYVPNMTFGAGILGGIDWGVPIEAHLMVNNPGAFFDMFASLGCETITFHIENTGRDEAAELMKNLHQRGVKAGIAIDGYTDPAFVSDDLLQLADQILLMSVKAGFGGQAFMQSVYDKVRSLRARGFGGEIEIDGGVNLDNAPLLKEAGVDIVVVGSFLMKKPADVRKDVISLFHQV